MKPPSYYSSLQDGGGFLCLGCVCFYAWIWDAEPDALAGFGVRSLGSVVPAEIRREVHRSQGVGAGGNSRGFTGQRGRGSAPSAALSALRTEPPPRMPGMRLVQYQLLALGSCEGPVCTVGLSLPQ